MPVDTTGAGYYVRNDVSAGWEVIAGPFNTAAGAERERREWPHADDLAVYQKFGLLWRRVPETELAR